MAIGRVEPGDSSFPLLFCAVIPVLAGCICQSCLVAWWLVDKCFPKQNELHKICNRNTLKIIYSCMNNIETIIKTHNSSIINKENNKTPDTCNFRKKEECPLPGKCTNQNVIYEAKVTTENDDNRYIGLIATPFKTRFSSHKASFNRQTATVSTDNRDKSNQTELSKHMWKLKDDGTPYNITWTIKRRAQPYSPRSRKCSLCLWEKYFIITADRKNTLNSRSELISTCRHKNKHLVSLYG